jgi:hypothetical protein
MTFNSELEDDFIIRYDKTRVYNVNVHVGSHDRDWVTSLAYQKVNYLTVGLNDAKNYDPGLYLHRFEDISILGIDFKSVYIYKNLIKFIIVNKIIDIDIFSSKLALITHICINRQKKCFGVYRLFRKGYMRKYIENLKLSEYKNLYQFTKMEDYNTYKTSNTYDVDDIYS